MRLFVCLLVASACLLVPGSGRSVKGGAYSLLPWPRPPPPRPQAPVQPVEEETIPEDPYVIGGIDPVEEGAIDQSDDGDDKNKDPDWLPDNTEDYDDEDAEYEYRDDEEYDDYGEDDYDEDDYDEDDEDDLWSSDDDPDYEPTDQEKYVLAVDEIADILISSPHLLSDPDSDQDALPSREELQKTIRNMNLTLEELTTVLFKFRRLSKIQFDIQGNQLITEDHNQEHELFSLQNSDETFPEPNVLPSDRYYSSKGAGYNLKGRKKRSIPTQQE